MILRRLTRHVEDQNWFAVALDFLVVVCGVGFALWAEQRLSDRALQREVAAFEGVIRSERMESYIFAVERQASARCRTERIAELAAAFRGEAGPWKTIAWQVSPANSPVPLPLRAPSRAWPYRSWEAGKIQGLTRQLDPDKALMLDLHFANTRITEQLQTDLYLELVGLAALATDTDLTRAERNAYAARLGRVAHINGLLDAIVRRIIDDVEVQGLDDAPDPSLIELPGGLSFADFRTSEFEEIAAIYGACTEGQDYPALAVLYDALPSQTGESSQ